MSNWGYIIEYVYGDLYRREHANLQKKIVLVPTFYKLDLNLHFLKNCNYFAESFQVAVFLTKVE